MATKPTIRLPGLPDEWFKDVTRAPAGGPDQAPGILDGLPAPRERSPADSSLNVVLPPDTMKTIDLSGAAAPEPPPWLRETGDGAAAHSDLRQAQPGAEGFYTGLTPYQPDPDARRPFHPGVNERPGQDWVQLPRP